MKQYKVVDLSYSQDPRQHLKDVRAFHELDGWHLLSVVHLHSSGRWLYYLEREAAAGPDPQGGVAAAPVGSEQSLPGPVRRVEGGSGEVVTAGADVTAAGVSVEVFSRPASSKEMELALRGVRIELHPHLVRGDETRVSWHVNLVDAAGRKLEGYAPKEFERMIERVRSLAQGESGR